MLRAGPGELAIRVKWLQNWGRGRTMGVAILLTSCSPSVTHQTSGGSSDTVHRGEKHALHLHCIGFSLARQL